jgi:hypothetical protein
MTGESSATLALSDRFLAQLKQMDKREYADVQRVIDRFHKNSRSQALDLESYNGSLDPRFRTMRATLAIRVIVWALEGSVYLLDEVVYNHEDAERASRNRRCQVGDATGVVRIVRIMEAEDSGAAVLGAPREHADRLFDDDGIRSLRKLQLNDDLVRVVVSFSSDDQLDALARLIPGYARELKAAYMIACEYSHEEAWAELTAADASAEGSSALQGIHIIRSETALQEVFAKPFLVWRTYLHRSQEELAHRTTFNGPVRVVGGPGTGKTVVAVHRAKYVAQAQRDVKGRRGVLLTAFSKTLAESMQECLGQLLEGAVATGIRVANIDAVVSQLSSAWDLDPVDLLDDASLGSRIAEAIRQADTSFSPSFVRVEWEDTVLAQQIRTEEAYLAARRPGSGRAMQQNERREMWRTIVVLQELLEANGEATYLSRADELLRVLAGRPRHVFDHAVIDESQDLHPVHWRLLRAIIPPGPNDLFLVGDINQQVFRRPFSLAASGIVVRGRVRRLGINYRTSAGILAWARQIAEGSPGPDPDGISTALGEYVSLIDGPLPTLQGFTTPESELRAVIGQVQSWIAQGIAPSAIAVICRDNAQCQRYEAGLGTAKIRTVNGNQVARNVTEAVAVITMHRSKGLEFRAVAIPELSDGKMPAPAPQAFVQDGNPGLRLWQEQERRLLFVACTRARELLWVSWSGKPSPLLPPELPHHALVN